MKKILLSALLLCSVTIGAVAATLSGTVFSTTTCSPVSGAKVVVYDSLFTWVDSAVTNSSGVYTITIPASLPSPKGLISRTTACGSNFYDNPYYTGSNLSYNLFVCGYHKSISGTLKLGGTSAGGPARVYLIRRDVVPVTFDTVLTAVDSVTTSNPYFNMRFACVPTGTFLLKAALLPAHPSYSNFLPSYHDSALNWSGGTVLSAAQLSGTANTNLNLRSGVNPGGPGFIGGSVAVGANKTSAVGDPLSRRMLILENSTTNKPVAYTYSDASGKFNFPNLAYGTYRIFGDAPGKTNPALTLTISATKQGYSNVLFEENNKTFKGTLNALSVSGSTALEGLSVYPNPVSDFVQINGIDAISGSKTIVLTDVTGAVISRQVTAQGRVAPIAMSALPGGIYILQVQTEAGSASFRIAK